VGFTAIGVFKQFYEIIFIQLLPYVATESWLTTVDSTGHS